MPSVASLARCDGPTLVWNFVVLGLVSLVPFAASLIGAYEFHQPRRDGGERRPGPRRLGARARHRFRRRQTSIHRTLAVIFCRARRARQTVNSRRRG
jgi:hypothetical protein